MNSPVRLLAVLGSLLVSGCGWHALYGGGPGDAPGSELSRITVALIPERSGQLLRTSLQARFGRGGSQEAPRYDLVVAYTLRADAVGILQDNTTTRVRWVATADWKLLAQNAQRSTVSSGFVRDLDGLNVINQQYFAADLESEALQRRMADAVADQIAQQLAVYFRSHPAIAA